MQNGGLKIKDCNNHVKSAIEFFGESCAPNSLKDIYNPIGDNSDKSVSFFSLLVELALNWDQAICGLVVFYNTD